MEPPWWDSCPYKKRKRLDGALSPLCGAQGEEGHLQAQKWAVTRHRICRHLDLDRAAFRTVRKKRLLCEPPSLWRLVTAAQADCANCTPASISLLPVPGLMLLLTFRLRDLAHGSQASQSWASASCCLFHLPKLFF